eukprot:scaffold328123_cov58-Tisochrysis_lutea.AAC.2
MARLQLAKREHVCPTLITSTHSNTRSRHSSRAVRANPIEPACIGSISMLAIATCVPLVIKMTVGAEREPACVQTTRKCCSRTGSGANDRFPPKPNPIVTEPTSKPAVAEFAPTSGMLLPVKSDAPPLSNAAAYASSECHVVTYRC